MNKPLSKNLHKLQRIMFAKFGVCKCCWNGEKTLKEMCCNWYLQKQIDKVQYNKHLKVYFRCFILTGMKKGKLSN